MRKPAWLFTLLAAAFVLYTDDYVIAGILPELATDLHITEGHAGQLVTVFSLTVAITAPVAAIVLANVPRRQLFTTALLIFITSNIAAAITKSFIVLTTLRVATALVAAATTPALFAFTAQHAPAHRVGRYIAAVSLGVTGSIAAGVPFGTWIGGILSWRATFATMAIAGVVVLLLVRATLPRSEGKKETPRLTEQLRILWKAPISLGLLANCLLMTGSMMMLTYLAPLPCRDHERRYRGTSTRIQPLRDRRHRRHLARRDRNRSPRCKPDPDNRYRNDHQHDAHSLDPLDRQTCSPASSAGHSDIVGSHGVLELPCNPSPAASPRCPRFRACPGAQYVWHLPRRLHRSCGRGRCTHPRWSRSLAINGCRVRHCCADPARHRAEPVEHIHLQ